MKKSPDDILIIKLFVLCFVLLAFSVGMLFYYSNHITEVREESLLMGAGIGYRNGQIDALKGKWKYRAISVTEYEEIPTTTQPAK